MEKKGIMRQAWNRRGRNRAGEEIREEEIMEKNDSGSRFPVNLFCSLLLLGFVPFLYTLVRTNLIADSPSTDGLGIAGHIEWFDLINETIQAFLIVPLYALLKQCIEDRDRLKERIFRHF